MPQGLKVFALRRYYRFISKHSWRARLAASEAGVACSERPNADCRAMLTELATWLENPGTTGARIES